MKIRTQFIMTMLLFGIILVVISASAIITGQELEKATRQEALATSIAQGASELSYLANDYLIYQEPQQLGRWQSKFTSFSDSVAHLSLEKPELQVLVRNIQANKNRLKMVFDSTASVVGGSSRNHRTALDSSLFQISWSRMAIQSQGLVSDASRLSQLLRLRMDRLINTRAWLMYAMVGLLGVFLLGSYFLTYRDILKSLATLQAGTAIIGSGNLDFKIEEKKQDEIGALAQAFNRMTTDLKSVTASKADLEREIQVRRQAQEALGEARDRANWLARFPEENPNPVIRVSVDGTILYYNPAASRIWGWESKTGQLLEDDFLPLLDLAKAQGKEIQQEMELGGMTYLIWVAAFPEEGYLNLYGRDITARKQAEEALIKAHKELQEHADRIEAVNKELESFNYSVSHDLRSPLRAIAGFTRMILNEKGATFDPETRRKFGIVEENAQKMGRLIDDLLRLSRLGRAELNWTRVDMKALASEVLQEIRMAEPDRVSTIEIGDLPSAHGDPAMIRQLLANLLSNALKFTRGKQGGLIEVGSLVQSGEQVYYVKDNGVGFDMKYYNKLFGVFQRLVSESQFEGTGVGLAIVQRIVQRHGGRVWAEGKVNEGATFYFTLP